MDIFKRIAELEKKMLQLTGDSVNEAEPIETEEPEAPSVEPVDIEGKLTPEIIEMFYDGLLSALGEMELQGQIPALDTSQQVRSALLAVVRQLYIRKSMISKMGRKFARFGAKRILRKQKSAIGRALSR